MQLTKYQNDQEREVLRGMIVSDAVLGRVAAQAGENTRLFRSRWSNVVAGWCIDHYRKFHEAPGEAVTTLFRAWSERARDEDEVATIEDFLDGLSAEHDAKDINEGFVLDRAGTYLNRVRMERMMQHIGADLERDDVDAAQARIASFAPMSISGTGMLDVLVDEESWERVLLAEQQDPLVLYPNALGEFFGRHLGRDCFFSFLAPEKRGKTYWLTDMAWRAAVLNRRRTVFYSAGDMTQDQMMRRLLPRAMRRPLEPGEVRWPKQMRVRDGEVRLRMEQKTFTAPPTFGEVRRGMRAILKKTGSKQSILKLRCVPADTLRVSDIHADLEGLARNGWVPDVVVIDYADILAPEIGASDDMRHSINTTWKALRRLSQEFHILVATATQSDAASYDASTIRRKNFSENKAKIAHVTGMAGINQTEDEKEQGVFRLNWIALREGVFYEGRCVTTAGCLALGNPAILSAM